MRKPLNTLRGGKPQLQVHSRCTMLRKGFLGRYQYRRVKISGSAERFHDEPDKNEFSHPHDALQYVATKVFGDSVKDAMPAAATGTSRSMNSTPTSRSSTSTSYETE